MATILTLSADILCDLVDLVVQADPPYIVSWDPVAYHLGWLRLTHVCNVWRSLIVNDMPFLWSRNVCTLPPAHRVMLERAKGLPLTLMLDAQELCEFPTLRLPPQHPLHSRVREFALAHINRARAMQTYSFDSRLGARLTAVPLPELKSVIFHRERPCEDHSVLALLAPKLLSATLHDIAPTFTSTSIRHLALRGSSIFSALHWSLLDILRPLMCLEFLELEMNPICAVHWGSPATSPVSLPMLDHMHVHGNTNARLSSLVECLSISFPVAEHAYFAHIEPTGWESFIEGLGHILHHASFNALFLAYDGVQIAASVFAAADGAEYSHCAPQSTLEVVHGSDTNQMPAIAAAMLACCHRERIVQLVIGHDLMGGHEAEIRDALRNLRRVVCLVLLSPHALDILELNGGAPLFPNLTSLVITMETMYDFGTRWMVESLQEWWDRVRQILQHRVDCGVPVALLRITSRETFGPWEKGLLEVDADGRVRAAKLVNTLMDTRVYGSRSGSLQFH